MVASVPKDGFNLKNVPMIRRRNGVASASAQQACDMTTIISHMKLNAPHDVELICLLVIGMISSILN